jgi:hypothetical protein
VIISAVASFMKLGEKFMIIGQTIRSIPNACHILSSIMSKPDKTSFADLLFIAAIFSSFQIF